MNLFLLEIKVLNCVHNQFIVHNRNTVEKFLRENQKVCLKFHSD